MSSGERRPELDGVRGIAILLVLIGHSVDWLAPLAAAGVALFFALSGYLITDLLLAELQQHGRLNLRRFYVRRFTRLAPPLFVMLAVIGAILSASWLQIALPAVWLSNYAHIAGADMAPYFEHTWSLALEEQFYLVWPVALLLLLRLRKPVGVLAVVTVILVLWRLWLATEAFPDYAYYALETGGVPVLGGCLVALSKERLEQKRATAGLLLLVGGALILAALDPALWSVAPLLAMPMTRDLVGAAAKTHWLSWRPLTQCGVASYSLYLWHVPMSVLVGGGLTPFGVAVGAATGLLMYRVVERPLMRWRHRRSSAVSGASRCPAEGPKPGTPQTSHS